MKKLATKLKHRKDSKNNSGEDKSAIEKLHAPLKKCMFRFIYSGHLALFIIIITKLNTIGRGPIKKLLWKV